MKSREGRGGKKAKSKVVIRAFFHRDGGVRECGEGCLENI
jgi:hypothetical protein